MLIYLFAAIVAAILYVKQSQRIKKCEEEIAFLRKQLHLEDTHNESPPNTDINEAPTAQIDTVSPSLNEERIEDSKPILETKVYEEQTEVLPPPPPAINAVEEDKDNIEQTVSYSELFQKIKDNWLGVVGSIVCVLGAVFFGITTNLLELPEVRSACLFLLASLMIGISFKKSWGQHCAFFRSAGAAIFLFTSVGSYWIQGLKWIDSPIWFVMFLLAGIGVNLFVVMTTPSAAIASFHVALSIVALCITEQNAFLLPVGAFVSVVGLQVISRGKSNLHHVFITLAFTVQHWLWNMFNPGWSWIGILCCLAVGSAGIYYFYSKKYQPKKFDLFSYCANWLLLGWNLNFYSHMTKSSIALFIVLAVALFSLAQKARLRKIQWLYHTDTLLSQFFFFLALAGVHRFFSIQAMDLLLFGYLEVILVGIVHMRLNEGFLVRIGYWMRSALYFGFICISVDALFKSDPFSSLILFKMALMSLASFALYHFEKAKNQPTDSPSYLFGDRGIYSIHFFMGTVSLGIIYLKLAEVSFFPYLAIPFLFACSVIRSKREDVNWDLSFTFIMLFLHGFSIWLLIEKHDVYRPDILGLIALDGWLIFGNQLRFKTWNLNGSSLAVYLLGLLVALTTYEMVRPISTFMPGMIALGYSLIFLEVARASRDQCREAWIHAAFAFLFLFLGSFVFMQLQLEAFWKGIHLRWFYEGIGVCSLGYWIAFGPRKIECRKYICQIAERIPEVLIAFMTFVVFLEVPEFLRPTFWAVMGIVLLSVFKESKRFYVYSWLYLVASIFHTTFITSNMRSITNHYLIYAVAASLCQLAYAWFAHKKKIQEQLLQNESKRAFQYMVSFPCISVILPIFIGVAFMFGFNYERTLLTLIWIALGSIYLSMGLITKTRAAVFIAMGAIAVCVIRLVVFDLVQTNNSIRAIVFLGAGLLMLGIGVIYKKFKYRVEAA